VWSALIALDRARGGSQGGIAMALASGEAFSVAFAARPVTATAVGAALLVLHLKERPRGSARLIAAALVGALPAAIGFLVIDGTLSGGWFRTVYGTYNLADNAVYGRTDLVTAGSVTLFNLSRMSTWLSGVGPGWLLPVIAVTYSPLGARGWLLVAIPASLFVFHSLHPFHGIPWVGPVYQSETLPYLALLSAQGLATVQSAFGPATRRTLMAIGLAGSTLLLFVHFSIARDEIELRDRPYAAARAAGIQEGVVFLRLEDLRSWRLHPLAPPPTGARLVFARDLGSRNADLLQALGDPPAWTWDPLRGELRPR
jgi:hypothetical protein